MDVLSDILGAVRLKGGVHFRCEFAAPWGMSMPATTDAPFHIVVRGNFWLRLPQKNAPIALQGGDLVVLTRGGAHALLDAPDRSPRPVDELIAGQRLDGYGPVSNRGGGQPASILCGYFRFDRDSRHPVLDALPPLIHIRNTDGQELAWLQAAVNFMVHETRAARPGAEAVVDRLAGVLFVQIVRSYIERSESPPGMLAAFADRAVGAALQLMHERPAEPWTLQALARHVGVSRSVFAERFHQRVGQTPMQYLTFWRMQLARRLLAETRLSMGAVGERVGYRSEASFGKMFKKAVGTGPAAYRRQSPAAADGIAPVVRAGAR
jgi:AraC family transcriptional activator of mtrCDE